jgi:hypothetical protein
VSKYLTARFVALYLALGIIGAGALAGAVALPLTIQARHAVAHVTTQLGDQNLENQATAYITQEAAAAGYGVKSIKITRTVAKGDSAKVYATVVLTIPQTTITQSTDIVVTLHRGIWQPSSLAAA